MTNELKNLLAEVSRRTTMLEEANRMRNDRMIELRKAKHDLRAHLTQHNIHEQAFRVGDTVYRVDNTEDELAVDVIETVEVQV